MTTALNRRIFASTYDRLSRRMEPVGVGAHRDELLAGLQGRVLEIGAGNGLNFSRYPDTVTAVIAVEPQAQLRALAAKAADEARVRVQLVDGMAEKLAFADATFDAAVASLVLCSVSDPAQVLAELHRVIRPGGELRFYEHVGAQEVGLRRFQKTVNVLWPHVAAGCNLTRDTAQSISEAGFEIRHERNFRFMPSRIMLPVAPHVIGTAVRA